MYLLGDMQWGLAEALIVELPSKGTVSWSYDEKHYDMVLEFDTDQQPVYSVTVTDPEA